MQTQRIPRTHAVLKRFFKMADRSCLTCLFFRWQSDLVHIRGKANGSLIHRRMGEQTLAFELCVNRVYIVFHLLISFWLKL